MELSTKHAEWLEAERAIPSEIAAAMGVHSLNGNLAFNFGTYVKTRTSDKDFKAIPAGVEPRFWNEKCLSEPPSPTDPLVITEGELDALSFLTAHVQHVVSVPNGAVLAKPSEGVIHADEDKPFRYLWQDGKLRRDLQDFRKIILATDNDERGLILRDELALRLGRNRCYWVQYPHGCKDGNDVLQRHGVEGLTALIDGALPLVPNTLTKFSDIPTPARRESFTSGWSGMDDHFRVTPPELVVVVGAPQSGKSQWTDSYVCNLARVHGIKTAILQFEDSIERIRADLFRYARAWQTAEHYPIRSDPSQWVDDHFVTVTPPDVFSDVEFDLSWLHNAIQEAACRHGCKVVLIDPWNELSLLWGKQESETQFVNRALGDLKALARRYTIAIIIVAHPGKDAQDVTSVDQMTLYSVSGSAAWNNKADHGICIYRETPTSEQVYIKVAKSREQPVMGYPGTVKMTFDPRTATYRYDGKHIKG